MTPNLLRFFAVSSRTLGTPNGAVRTVGHIARRTLAPLGAAASLLLVLAAPAAAAVAPAALTGPVTAVAGTTATLSGTVNPNGTTTSWYFEYGTTTTYGTKTPVANAGAGTANIAVTANIGSLTVGPEMVVKMPSAPSVVPALLVATMR